MPSDTSGYPEDFAKLLDAYNSRIEHLMARLERKEINDEQWFNEMQDILATYAQAAKALGTGIDLSNPDVESSSVESTRSYLDNQFEYLSGFQAVIKTAPEYNPAWLPRAQMYGASLVTEYWEGQTEGLPLPAQPGQGTQCLGNCKCSWRIEWIGDKSKGNADCYWELGKAEHCQTCEVRHEMWYPIQIRGGNLGDVTLPPEPPKPEPKPEPTPPTPKPAPKPKKPKAEPKPTDNEPGSSMTGKEAASYLRELGSRRKYASSSERRSIELRALEAISARNPSNVKLRGSTRGFSADQMENLKYAMERFNNVIEAKTLGKLKTVTAIPVSDARSYCDWKSSNICIGPTARLTTMVHEMGHAWEFKGEDIQRAANKFLKARAKGEQLQWLGGNYDQSEKAYFDKFKSPYAGKVYPGTRATEIISMGLQEYVTDPIQFAMDDPEYFEFIHNITKGISLK